MVDLGCPCLVPAALCFLFNMALYSCGVKWGVLSYPRQSAQVAYLRSVFKYEC